MGENVPPNSESVGDDEFGKNCDSQSSQFVASPNRVQKKQGDKKLIRAAVAAVVQRKRTLNREHCLIHCAAIRYHFIIAVWTAKQAQAAAYENEHSVFDSSSVLRVLFDFANSTSRATEQFRLG